MDAQSQSEEAEKSEKAAQPEEASDWVVVSDATAAVDAESTRISHSDSGKDSDSSDDEKETEISRGSHSGNDAMIASSITQTTASENRIRVTGMEPAFENSLVRQRVKPDGTLRPMEPIDTLSALLHPRDSVGVISPNGPIKRWLEKRGQWDAQYRRDLLHSRKIKLKDRRKAAQAGYLSRDLVGEDPPLSAVAGMWDEQLAWEAVKGQDGNTGVDGDGVPAGLGVMLWSQLSLKPDAEHQGKKALDELAKRGESKLKKRPSSVQSLDVEKEMEISVEE